VMTATFAESPSPIPPSHPNLAALHAVPISERPRRTWAQFLNGVAFSVLFNLGCVLTNVTQFVLLLPLRVLHLLPFGRRLYDTGIRRSKGAFGTLLGEVYASMLAVNPTPPHTPLPPASRVYPVIVLGGLLTLHLSTDWLVIPYA